MRFSKLVILATVSIFIFPLVVGLSSTAARAQTVRWRQIIGIIDPGNDVGVGTGQVTGAGQPWSTRQGTARVKLGTGDLHFRVRGLVLAGGGPAGDAPIGTNPAPMVRGTLVCDIDGSLDGTNSVLVDTDPVPMSAQGDASIDTNLGPLPAACDEPDIAFLIRIVMGPGPWIANGAVRIP